MDLMILKWSGVSVCVRVYVCECLESCVCVVFDALIVYICVSECMLCDVGVSV